MGLERNNDISYFWYKWLIGVDTGKYTDELSAFVCTCTATDFMSMAANTSDRGDNMTEANLQADGLMEEPAQRATNWKKMEEEDSSPLTCLCGPLFRDHLRAVLI